MENFVFLQNLVNGAVVCSVLLAKINLKVQGPTRSTDLFVHTLSSTNYLKFGPMARIERLGNSAGTVVDFFFDKLRVIYDITSHTV